MFGSFTFGKEKKERKANFRRRYIISEARKFDKVGRVLHVGKSMDDEGTIGNEAYGDMDMVVIYFLSGNEYYRGVIRSCELGVRFCKPQHGQIYRFFSKLTPKVRETYTLIQLSDIQFV